MSAYGAQVDENAAHLQHKVNVREAMNWIRGNLLLA